jgi:hypothetical protein
MNDPARPAPGFTALDWFGTVAAGFGALALLTFPIAGRSFATMLRDFGSPEHLPALTKLAVSWWFPMALALPVAAALVFALRQDLALRKRRACIVAAFILGGIALAVCVIGVYLPVFSLAGAMKAE